MSCSSDEVTRSDKNVIPDIFKNLSKNKSQLTVEKNLVAKETKNSVWLATFKRPIILISSLYLKKQATLVQLGFKSKKDTWVSSDGISLSFENGILIATRGYSQDLIALKHKDIKKVLASRVKSKFSKNSQVFRWSKQLWRHRIRLLDN